MDALRIALCDDVSTEKELLEQYIRQWADSQSLPVCVRSFSDGQSLLHAMEREAFPIVFLDIQMQGLDGMETARRIRQIDGSAKEAGICFVTGYEDYLAEGYEVEAFRYLIKPVRREKLWEALDSFLRRMQQRRPFWTVETPNGQKRVALSEVLYLEAFGHTCTLHGDTESFTVKLGITAAQEQMTSLGLAMFRCHRSYLVNIARITGIERECAVLESGIRIPVSRKSYEPMNRAFIQYFRNHRNREV